LTGIETTPPQRQSSDHAGLERRGTKIPWDTYVTDFDDSLAARHSRMDLTAVNQDPAEHARLTVKAAIERRDEGRTDRREIVLPATLVVRGSTGPVQE
jgi:DNA-binding LacI/PurR family transcriptional regulator